MILKETQNGELSSIMEQPKVFIGNLPFDVDHISLSNFIKANGVQNCVSVRVVEYRSGKSRGFAYVDFDTSDDAAHAVALLKESEIGGRSLTIDLACGVDSDMSGRGKCSKEYSAFIGNLDFDLTRQELAEEIEQILGDRIPFRVRIASIQDRSRGFGHIDFINDNDVASAIEKLNGAVIRDRAVNVERAVGQTIKSTNIGAKASKFSGSCSIFLGNLAFDVSVESLRALVEDLVGPSLATNIRLATNKYSEAPRGFAHLDFVDADAALLAVEALDGTEYQGRVLRADLAQQQDLQWGQSLLEEGRQGRGQGRVDFANLGRDGGVRPSVRLGSRVGAAPGADKGEGWGRGRGPGTGGGAYEESVPPRRFGSTAGLRSGGSYPGSARGDEGSRGGRGEGRGGAARGWGTGTGRGGRDGEGGRGRRMSWGDPSRLAQREGGRNGALRGGGRGGFGGR